MSNVYKTGYAYIESNGETLFTVILLPFANGKFPTVAIRMPYVDKYENMDEESIVADSMKNYEKWLQNGYAVIFQHCRGRGKSSGDCIPYINEREDGINLLNWIRKQSFYNGEIFLHGHSYSSSVWYTTAPFESDIKGAIFGAQDTERYNICYRNGFLKKGLHGHWYVGMYKAKSHMKKNYTLKAFDILPLADFTKTVFGESADDFDQLIKAPDKNSEFWNTRYGGNEARNATDNADFPILLTTSFYDIYTGGIFDMWNSMSEKTRNMSALVVSPYDHGDNCNKETGIEFDKGKKCEMFGDLYGIEWFNHIRKKDDSPFEKGKVTYYRLFENKWATDSFSETGKEIKLTLGDEKVSYVYNPFDAPSFKGGLSRAFGGSCFQDAPNSRYDIISIYTEPFSKDTFVKGKMGAKLCVASDCEDTCFYVRISIAKENGDFGLRDDINSLCHQLGDYEPGTEVSLEFEFDEHAFLIEKGEKLRIDIASADNDHYVRHTNMKGLYGEQKTAKVAHNSVNLKNSYISLAIE